MKLLQPDVEQSLIEYTDRIFEGRRTITKETRICGDLGLCDEDLWEMIDEILDDFGIPKPTGEHPARIDIKQSELTVAMLANWICGRAG